MKKIYAILILMVALLQARAQPLYFPPLSGNAWDTLSPYSLNWCQKQIDSLYAFLEANNTKAFIVLRGGKIVLEKYFGTHTQSSPWQWASAGKTVTAFMVGMAQQEKKLSIQDPATKYLGRGWTSCTPAQEDKITVRHQLTMTSGLDDGVLDPFCTLDTCLKFKAEPGTRWAYHNGPYTLLDQVIEKATGIPLNTYTTQKLKNPTGMTGSFLPVGYNNVFFSTARSMARFGLLILNKGNWNGNPILTDTAYYRQMVNTSQNLNQSYGYLWWLNGKPSHMLPGPQFVFNGFLNPNAPPDMFVAMGRDGQFLNVVPSQQLVVVRMGNAPSDLPVPYLMNNEIWRYINNLECTTTSAWDRQYDIPPLKIFPNPVRDILHVEGAANISRIQIFNLAGQLLQTIAGQGKILRVPLDGTPKGMYFAKVFFDNGGAWTSRFVKE